MARSARRRNILIAIAIIILILLLLFLTRCRGTKPAAPAPSGAAPPSSAPVPAPDQQRADADPAPQPDEILTPATITAPAEVAAGAAFSVTWTGPDNPGDYLTVSLADNLAEGAGNYEVTQRGSALELTAPIDPGDYEVRYIAARSRTILGRAALKVLPIAASLEAPAEVVLGSAFEVSWTGPNNTGDFVTIIAQGAPDEAYGSYMDAGKGSPQMLTAPPEAGDAEVRYVSGQGKKVLARRAVRVVVPQVGLEAPAEAVAGTSIEVAWTGPNNAGDYITVVPIAAADGKYDNYTNTSTGSPLRVLLPIMSGAAEVRYMTGQGGRVLARRSITIVAAAITLSASEECAPASSVSISWTGPNNPGDYITIVPKDLPDGQYRDYANTSNGSPLTVRAPKDAGEAEIRYMTGQGNKVLARIPIKIVP